MNDNDNNNDNNNDSNDDNNNQTVKTEDNIALLFTNFFVQDKL